MISTASVMRGLIKLVTTAAVVLTLSAVSGEAKAQAFNLGPEACQNCHKPEYEVWQKTKHAESFKDFHRSAKTRDVLKVTTDKSPKQSAVCTSCHYTTAQKDAAAKPDQVAGPSCESCHGAASNWLKLHNDYGGPGVKKEDEKPDHKAKRLADSKAAGMIRPEIGKYDVVANCYDCHALGKKSVDGKIIGAMIDAGHPTNNDFEFIKFSQGQVRHRFYPPDTSNNKEPSATEKAEWYAIGQAAALVAATQGLGHSDNAKYVEAEKARIAKAKEVLGKIPEAAKLIAAPTPENGRAFGAAILGKDLTKVVGAVPGAPYK